MGAFPRLPCPRNIIVVLESLCVVAGGYEPHAFTLRKEGTTALYVYIRWDEEAKKRGRR